MQDVTTLLKAAQGGEKDAANKLFSILYQDLRKLAREQLRRQTPNAQLDTTALVHESYLKLQSCGILEAQDRRHFLAYAAAAMRSAIVDLARSQLAKKRGGEHMLVTLSTFVQNSAIATDEDVLRIHEAIEELAVIDERLARVVELRYFGGLSEDEIAATLGVARRTAQRDWEKARLFLISALKQ